MTLFTVGHSTRLAEEFIELLTSHGAELLVDVRQFPGSRRFPHFGSAALAADLNRSGIDYVHEPDLGGRRKPAADSPNTFWRSASFRAYADYMQSDTFREALERLIHLASERTTAIMCAEAVPWRCHRQLIADALVARGVEVRHIMSPTRTDLHILNPGARREADGTLVYPASGETQRELFSKSE